MEKWPNHAGEVRSGGRNEKSGSEGRERIISVRSLTDLNVFFFISFPSKMLAQTFVCLILERMQNGKQNARQEIAHPATRGAVLVNEARVCTFKEPGPGSLRVGYAHNTALQHPCACVGVNVCVSNAL